MSKSTPGALPPDHAPGSEPVEIVKWHDEETQQAPLPLKVARLASDDEMDIWLGERIWRGRSLLKGQVSHWLARNTLLAVVDTLMWRAAVRTQVPKPLLVSTEFVTRPPSAGTPPEGFRVVPLDDLFWKFALYGDDSVVELPAPLLVEPLILKQLPKLSPGLLAARDMRLMRLISAQAMTLDQLQQILEANRQDLMRSITALYLTRALAGPGMSPPA